MIDHDFLDEAPTSDQLQPYDERHLVTYLQLLDAEADRADWKETVRRVLHCNPDDCVERAKKMLESHLARARWMSREGYRQLAARGHEKPPIN
jgi:hypothetical protein